MITAVVNKNTPGLRINSDAVHVVEVARPLVVRRVALLAPIHYEFAVLVELCDARAVVAVRHEHGAVRQPRQERGPVEVRAVRPLHGWRAYRLHELLSVVRELVDRVHVIVNQPYVLLRIIRINRNIVRPLHDLVPLRPLLGDVAIAVDNRQAVFPFGIYADRALPEFGPIVRILASAAGARQRGNCSIAPWQAPDRKLNAWPEIGQQLGLRPLDVGQLAPEYQENAVGIFGVYALARSPSPLFI